MYTSKLSKLSILSTSFKSFYVAMKGVGTNSKFQTTDPEQVSRAKLHSRRKCSNMYETGSYLLLLEETLRDCLALTS